MLIVDVLEKDQKSIFHSSQRELVERCNNETFETNYVMRSSRDILKFEVRKVLTNTSFKDTFQIVSNY